MTDFYISVIFQKRAKVREEVDSADIDAKTFEEAEASIKALVEGTEPRLITKSDGTSAPGRIQANGDVETDDSFTEFEILSEVNMIVLAVEYYLLCFHVTIIFLLMES